MPEGMPSALAVAAAVLLHLGLALVIGSLASQAWMWRCHSAWRALAVRQAVSARRTGFVLGLVGILGALWMEAAAMSDAPHVEIGATLAPLLLQTHFGHAWLAGLVAWLTAAGLLSRRPGADSTAVTFAAGGVVTAIFVGTRSVVSHAGSQGDFTLDVAVDALHLGLVCLWIGVVFAGARLTWRESLTQRAGRQDVARWVSRMSATATFAIVGIAATGAFKVWRAVESAASPGQFVGSSYGQVLGVKLTLVVLAVALGGINRLRVLPRLFEALAGAADDDRWGRRLVGILRVEALTLTLALAAAAVLSGLEPPGAA
jgi:putative copper resistance protein D